MALFPLLPYVPPFVPLKNITARALETVHLLRQGGPRMTLAIQVRIIGVLLPDP